MQTAIENLPHIDGVLLSHNHYDHLDRHSLTQLGMNLKILCPVGVKFLLERWGFDAVSELSWSDAAQIGDCQLTCLPAQHCSGRSLFDQNRSLWCSWMIESEGRRAIFLGDTGYHRLYRELGDYYGGVDLAMIPIGAYRPRWFMRSMHLSPTEAALIHRDLRSRRSVAMHWGTFRLADEPMDEPPRLLRAAMSYMQIPENAFRVIPINETLQF